MLKNTLMIIGLLLGAVSLSAQVETSAKTESFVDIVSPELIHETGSHLFYIYRENISSAFLVKVRRSDLTVEYQSQLLLNPLERKMERTIQSWRIAGDQLIYFALYNHMKKDYRELWAHSLDLNSGEPKKTNKALKRTTYKKYMDQVTLDAWYVEAKDQYYVFEHNKRYKKEELKESLTIFDANFQAIDSIQYDSEGLGQTSSSATPLFDQNGSVYFSDIRGIIQLDATNGFASSRVSIPEDLVEGPEYLMQLNRQWIGANGHAYFMYTHKKLYNKMTYFDTREQKSSKLTEGIYILDYDPSTNRLNPISHQMTEGSMNLFVSLAALMGVRTAKITPIGGTTYPKSGYGNDVAYLQDPAGTTYYVIAHSGRGASRMDVMSTNAVGGAQMNSQVVTYISQYDRFLFALNAQQEVIWHKNIDYYSSTQSAGMSYHEYDSYFGFKLVEDGAYLGIVYNELEDNLGQIPYDRREAMDDPQEAIPVIDRVDPATGKHQQSRLDHLLDPSEEDFAININSLAKSTVDGQFYYILSDGEYFKVARSATLLEE